MKGSRHRHPQPYRSRPPAAVVDGPPARSSRPAPGAHRLPQPDAPRRRPASPGRSGRAPGRRSRTGRRTASTSSGSNCVPACRRSSAIACSWRDGPLVRAVVGHRVVGVGDRHDPGAQRDLARPQPERVAVAGVSLVVVQDDRHRVLERGGLLEDDLADARMLDDGPPLGRASAPTASRGSPRGRPPCRRRGAAPRRRSGRPRSRAAASCWAMRDDDRRDERRRLAAVVGERRRRRTSARPSRRRAPAGRSRSRGPGRRPRSGRAAPGRRRRARRRCRSGCGRATWPSTSPRRRRGPASPSGAGCPTPPAMPIEMVTAMSGLPSTVKCWRSTSVRSFSAEDRALLDVGLGEDQHEFLAAVAADEVARAQVAGEGLGDAPQHHVAAPWP